ncbi:MAG: helix-turn-helix domain-containing protein [Ruminococcus sp.]|nr:helix-turn-helix domain-containing protein [Ruminococcus sp.]
MIKHITNDFETVEYDAKQSVMMYDNVQFEEYPVHWHKEIEIIMPVRKNYYIEIAGKKYDIKKMKFLSYRPLSSSSTEIAVRSGFKSLATFNRVFRTIKYCTPTDFKKFYEKTD